MNDDLKDKIQTYYLSVGEIFGASLKIYISSFKYILILAITVFIPQLLLHYYMPDSIKYGWIDSFFETGNVEYVYKYLLYAMVSFSSFFPLTMGYLAFITLRSIDNNYVNFTSLLENVFSKWLKFAFCGIVYFIVTVCTSLMIVFSIYFAVIFSFTPFYILLHNKPGIYPFIQSKNLVKGKFLHIFSFMLMLLSSVWVANTFVSWLIVSFIPNPNYLFLWGIQLILQILNCFFYVVFSVKFYNLISIVAKQ